MDLEDQIIQYIKVNSRVSFGQILKAINKPRSTVLKALFLLVKSGKLLKEGKHPHITYRINIQAPQPSPKAESKPFNQPSPTETQPEIPSPAQPESPRPMPSRQDNPLPYSWDPYSFRQWILKRLCLDAEGWLQRLDSRQRLIGIALAVILGVIGYQLYHYYSPQAQAGRLRQELRNTQEELRQSHIELYNTKNDLNRKGLEIKSQTAQGDYNGRQFDQLKLQLSASNEGSKKLRDQIQELQDQMRTMQRDQIGLKNENQQKTRQMEYLERDKKRLQNKLDEQDSSRKKLEDDLRALRQTNLDLDKQVQNQKFELAAKERQIKDLQAKQTTIQSAKFEPFQHITIDQIVSWTRQGVPADEIIRRIKESHSTYVLTLDDLQYLKDSNVSLQVQKAMQE